MPEPATPSHPLRRDYLGLREPEIVRLCQKGDLEAFNILIHRYEEKVVNLAYRFLRDYHLALDEAQEVFLKIFKRIHSYEGKSSFGTWLYRVTSNHCINVIERRRRERTAISLDAASDHQDYRWVRDAHAVLPDEAYAQEELQRRVAAAIRKLPAPQQQAIILQHYENFSHEEIARIMQVPVSTVNSCLHRARSRLRKALRLPKQGGGFLERAST